MFLLVCLLLAGGLCNEARATTWAPKKVNCPLRKTENTFMEVMSFGTYIYQWPSKFQLIFWPHTDPNVLYSCRKCRLTAFMWDFAEVPAESLPAIKSQLQASSAKPFDKPYYELPMSERLVIAEKVYSILGKEDVFWCQFYRVKGYHLEAEKNETGALAARGKALELCQKLLATKENAGMRKELLLISGAMKHFQGNDQGSLADLREAASLTYNSPKMDEERNGNYDKYLSGLLKEYVTRVESGVKPSNR
jgi:hypothetical protein